MSWEGRTRACLTRCVARLRHDGDFKKAESKLKRSGAGPIGVVSGETRADAGHQGGAGSRPSATGGPLRRGPNHTRSISHHARRGKGSYIPASLDTRGLAIAAPTPAAAANIAATASKVAESARSAVREQTVGRRAGQAPADTARTGRQSPGIRLRSTFFFFFKVFIYLL